MGGQHGTQNTEDFLTLAKIVAVAILKEVQKDGWQPSDLGAFLKSPDFEAALVPAVKDAHLVPQELSELDLFDGLKLAKFAYGVMDDILDEIKSTVKK